MRIARGNQVIGEWSVLQVKKRIADASLLITDSYYDEEVSEWMPLTGLSAMLESHKPVKAVGRPCYCGSGLPFNVCHGDGAHY